MEITTNIKFFRTVSILEWDSKIVSVIVLGGCNFRCPFCHNAEIVLKPNTIGNISFNNTVLKYLNERKGSGYIDGVVITGGEPFTEPNLYYYLIKIKDLGYPIKIDTNGSYPNQLKEFIEKGLINAVSMDIKAPLESYKWFVEYPFVQDIQDSIKIIKESGIEYEFRTTIVPHVITLQSIHKIYELIEGVDNYTLQQFVIPPKGDMINNYLKFITPYNIEVLEKMKEIGLKRYGIKNIKIKGE